MAQAPCAACHYLGRECTNDCIFRPYFPQEQSEKFLSLHTAFGASNVAKLLNDLPQAQRREAVISLIYEAEARLGRLENELSAYIGPLAILPTKLPGNHIAQYQHNPSGSAVLPYNTQRAQMMGGLPPDVASPGPMVIQQQPQYQQIMEAKQVEAVAAAAMEHELLRTNEQKQQQQQQQQQVGEETKFVKRKKCGVSLKETLTKWQNLNNNNDNSNISEVKKNMKRPSLGPKKGYRGVSQRITGKWGAQIQEPKVDGVVGKKLWLGTFTTAVDAAVAYDKAARKIYGPNAMLNFPNKSCKPQFDSVKSGFSEDFSEGCNFADNSLNYDGLEKPFMEDSVDNKPSAMYSSDEAVRKADCYTDSGLLNCGDLRNERLPDLDQTKKRADESLLTGNTDNLEELPTEYMGDLNVEQHDTVDLSKLTFYDEDPLKQFTLKIFDSPSGSS